MGVKDENQRSPAGIFYPAFFTSTRSGPANVATAGKPETSQGIQPQISQMNADAKQ